jgi:hypothetical protein
MPKGCFMKKLVYNLLLIPCLTSGLFAQTLEEHKIFAADGAPEDWFGGAVAIEGDYIIVGARMDDISGSSEGSAYIFTRDTSGWIEQAKLLASDGADDARFGRSVSIFGSYAIVGAHKADADKGAAYVYSRSGSTWTQMAKLSASDGAEGDFFGTSVGIFGDYAVVGAFGAGNSGDSAGAAYVFLRVDTAWVQQAKLVPSDADTNDRFGRAVAIHGDRIVVGSYGDDDLGGASGSVYVYDRSGTVWTETTKLLASDGSSDAHLGISVGLSGDYLIAGAYTEGPDSIGAAYVYKNEAGVWSEKAKLVPPDGGPGDEFGVSVAIIPGSAVVGSRLDDDADSSSGSAYFFEEDGSGWTQVFKMIPADIDSAAEFGRDVALSSTDALVGSLFATGANARSGAAYVYNDITLDVDDQRPQFVPDAFKLQQNYPNPFNPSTLITFQLDETDRVELTVHNLIGQQIRSLLNGRQAPGSYSVQWDGKNEKGEDVAAGIYLYRLESGEKVQTRKMVLMK